MSIKQRHLPIWIGILKFFPLAGTILIARQDIKILSYGCSTGEEVLTLRNYFPNAHIIGAEINKHSLAKCRQLPVDEKINLHILNTSRDSKAWTF